MQLVRLCFAVVILIPWAATAASTDVRVSSGARPAVLDQAALPDTIDALALSPDGARLAYARPAAREGFTDLVWLEAGATESDPVTIQGDVRDLVFLEDGRSLAGLHHRPAKKRQGDTFLFTWAGDPKISRIMRVPPSSSDLDRWPGGDALLLACRNEVRTFLEPDFRSGPLFSLPGDNFAVTSLGNSTYVVVGQAEGLSLLDLSIPSGRLSMPVLASLRTPARVAGLADDAEGDEVLVRLIDGRLFLAAFDPPGLRAAGSATHIAGLAKAASGPVLPFARGVQAVAEPAAEPEILVAEIQGEPATRTPPGESRAPDEPESPPAEPETRPADPPAKPELDPQPETPPVDPPVKPEPDAETETPAADPPAKPEPDPEPEMPPVAASRQIEGQIVGRLELVQAVVLLGPDNILREAARIRPDADGTWGTDGLAPGRYRIQLDGGGDRVLVAEPRFLMVDVGDRPTRAPKIRAVRSF